MNRYCWVNQTKCYHHESILLSEHFTSQTTNMFHPQPVKTAAVPWIICSPTWFDVPPNHQIYIANSMQQLVPRPPRSTTCSLHMQRKSRNITQCWHCVKIRLHASDTRYTSFNTCLRKSNSSESSSKFFAFHGTWLWLHCLSCLATFLSSFSWHDFWTCNLLQ